ncbi:hypothetical protein HPB47_006056 [Ixodes persulcatus]|uniref:Uncharacterized protein n=1 Tax=Ixodes persulcatus TaxID=34615 RepID=A0AC60PBY7_IXOPE|nr:hypothetical protein HPB47_006056 [Ixodes persulcatus]
MSSPRVVAGSPTDKTTSRKYPEFTPTTATLCDSQIKFVFQNFDIHQINCPAFISVSGARVADIIGEPSSVPGTVRTLVFHVGTSGLADHGAARTLERVCGRREERTAERGASGGQPARKEVERAAWGRNVLAGLAHSEPRRIPPARTPLPDSVGARALHVLRQSRTGNSSERPSTMGDKMLPPVWCAASWDDGR